jgi:hypothetical protein
MVSVQRLERIRDNVIADRIAKLTGVNVCRTKMDAAKNSNGYKLVQRGRKVWEKAGSCCRIARIYCKGISRSEEVCEHGGDTKR